MKYIFKLYLVTFFILVDFIAFAQTGPGDEDGGGPGGLEGDDPAPAPINSKLILLAIVGVLFVLYTYRKNKKTI